MRPLIVRQLVTRSSAALAKRRWRKFQREGWGRGRSLSSMTEMQIWWLVRILVLLLNNRDGANRSMHVRALARRLDWSLGVLVPRLARLETLEWVTSDVSTCVIKGKRCQVRVYTITGAGEAAAVVMVPFLQELVAIEPREHRRL
jgi:hypothetical protein